MGGDLNSEGKSMTNKELVQGLRECAEWAEANEWETPIMLGDYLKAAADELERQRDNVPDVHAEWTGFPCNGVWALKCSNCHRLIPMGKTPNTMRYCYNCGAKMDGA